jgi:ring-1,2-phenylacetyl-CoA epoxidase subunit PaaD
VASVATPLTQDELWAAVNAVQDPHLGVGLVDMGMVQSVSMEDGTLHVRLILPCLGCSALTWMRDDIRDSLAKLPGVEHVEVEMAWDEAWSKKHLSDEGAIKLRDLGVEV